MVTVIFILTLTGIIWRSRRLGIGWIALGGTLGVLIAGIINLEDIGEAWETIGNPMLILVSLILIYLIFNEAGFFFQVARLIIGWGDGFGRWLLLILVLLAAVVTAPLTNYGSILIWTPIVIETLRLLGFQPKTTLVYVLATGFMADVASLIFPFSNVVNGITIDYFGISFIRYVLVMMPVDFTMLLTSIGILWFYFDRYIPINYDQRKIPLVNLVRDPLICRWSFAILGWVVIGNLFREISGLFAILAALMTIFLAGRWFSPDKSIIPLNKLLRRVPWQIVIFSIGMYFVAIALGKTYLISLLSQIFTQLSGWGITLASMGTGFLAMLLSGLSHNLPTMVNNILAMQNTVIADPAIEEAMVYANLIGCNIGAKITPIGSLSTLLWFDILQRQGLSFSWSQYFRIHIVLIVPLLFIGLLFLAIWLPWLIA
ncbi:MAG: arsenical efflux pump membrane protein ArsB [Moorea sp. SIO2B7]|nr:arsenical efflux pump membrane protein ArsB [Moorena sp. SIO2B7]